MSVSRGATFREARPRVDRSAWKRGPRVERPEVLVVEERQWDDLGVGLSIARLALYGLGAQSGSLSQSGVCVTCWMSLPSAFIV
jgi:hypothetical protein